MDVPITTEDTPPISDESIVVDALVGYGLSDALGGTAAELAGAAGDASAIVSLDVPSGRDATTGETPGPAITADRTVTLALPKTGLEAVTGRVLLADIGIPAAVYDRLGIEYTDPFETTDRVPLD